MRGFWTVEPVCPFLTKTFYEPSYELFSELLLSDSFEAKTGLILTSLLS
jgi:hypothetical protein